MNTAANNPPTNALRSGVTDALVGGAIQSSGYPLQLVVAKLLAEKFDLQEEWSYVDSETGTARTIDLVAVRRLFEWKEPQPRIRPALSLVIECKQSDLPYVFFLSGGHSWLPDFPVISGLYTRDIVLTSDDDPSSWTFRPVHVLDLEQHPFLTQAAPLCITLSKCVRKGADLDLSGSEAYQSLILPLLKAVSHYEHVQTPPPTAYYFDCELVIGVAVLDAPMVGVRLTGTGVETQLLPWVRVVRHQPGEGKHKSERTHVHGIDVVHKDFLSVYLEQNVFPFAQEFSRRALTHAHVLADGRGFAPSLGKNSWTDITGRLQPATLGTGRKRFGATLKHIVRQLANRKEQ